ncbi:hypothetical protein [Phaffia rhodozyma]|uniref:Uncharacterized protein n=1 Tax=Phaffia rhodozyma TaxID=264483 RepID=A0A0F7SM18_PHARH|nr:hypothetical protein [Phaffia rhodozyma]
MAYLDYKDQIRLALALYVVKHRGEKSIDEFVEEMRSRFKANRLGVPPSPRSSLTQIRTQPSIPSLLGLWNDRPFPLSDRRILELDIFLQEALSVHSGPDLVCAGSIIGLLMTINQTLYLRPVQDPPSSTSSVQSLKSLTLKLIRTLHVLLRLVLILPPSLSKLDFAETNPREIISCVYLILQTTLREVLPRLTLREVTTVCRFIGREVFSEVARALSDRMAGNMHRHEGNMSDGGTKVVDGIEKIGRNKSDGDVDDADDDNGGKETFPLLKLLYALIVSAMDSKPDTRD